MIKDRLRALRASIEILVNRPWYEVNRGWIHSLRKPSKLRRRIEAEARSWDPVVESVVKGDRAETPALKLGHWRNAVRQAALLKELPNAAVQYVLWQMIELEVLLEGRPITQVQLVIELRKAGESGAADLAQTDWNAYQLLLQEGRELLGDPQ